jgi:hypothetical protein
MSDQPQHSLINRTQAELAALMAYLFAAIIATHELESTLTEEQQEIVSQLKAHLLNLSSSTKFFMALLTEMDEALKILARQRQHSKDSFLAGWRGFYRDLMSHLTAEQRAELLPIMDSILGTDDDNPF